MRRWYENLEANSVITATVYLRTLGLYCDLARTIPKRILEEAPSKRFRDGFTDFIRGMERKGKAGSCIERFKKVILSWTSYNNLDVKLKVNIKGASDTPTIANERVPRKDELSRNSKDGIHERKSLNRHDSVQWFKARESRRLLGN